VVPTLPGLIPIIPDTAWPRSMPLVSAVREALTAFRQDLSEAAKEERLRIDEDAKALREVSKLGKAEPALVPFLESVTAAGKARETELRELADFLKTGLGPLLRDLEDLTSRLR
jgi:hypothetical protein